MTRRALFSRPASFGPYIVSWIIALIIIIDNIGEGGQVDNIPWGFRVKPIIRQNIHQQLYLLCVNKLVIYFFKRTIFRSSNGQMAESILDTEYTSQVTL